MNLLNEKQDKVANATLTRRQFVKAGGALFVSFGIVGASAWPEAASAASPANTLDPTLPGSWIEIHPDNTILIRTGKSDFGQSSTFTAYRQIVAEELYAPFEAITTVVTGDTDRTPDGSGAFDFLGRGNPNIRKAAAYSIWPRSASACPRASFPSRTPSFRAAARPCPTGTW
jgi:CO/xanthine dehydrogenase Mo-binding subunit